MTEEYHIEGYLFVLVRGSASDVFIVNPSESMSALLLFDDEDQALTYVAHSAPDYQPAMLSKRDDLLALLEHAKKKGAKHVAWNPGKTSCPYLPIDEFTEEARRQLG